MFSEKAEEAEKEAKGILICIIDIKQQLGKVLKRKAIERNFIAFFINLSNFEEIPFLLNTS